MTETSGLSPVTVGPGPAAQLNLDSFADGRISQGAARTREAHQIDKSLALGVSKGERLQGSAAGKRIGL